MATFPKLKTDAVMQYPATRSFRSSHGVMRFLDGAEQHYRETRGPLRRWQIRLDLLDEAEIASLESFFMTNQGRFASFSFVDPWDNAQYPDCSLDQDVFSFDLIGEMRGRTALVVRQNVTNG